ncbi:hypothetical protein SAMN05446635_2509 [Burkholderia sp. OK233]|nr:hypothetical protein SAMN05446635_2509 [Burkholderia sp. OK233]
MFLFQHLYLTKMTRGRLACRVCCSPLSFRLPQTMVSLTCSSTTVLNVSPASCR